MKKLIVAVVLAIALLSFTALANAAGDYDYYLKVNFANFRSYLYSGSGELVASYRVALPRSRLSLPLPVEGEIDQIIFHPSWFPTGPTREAYFRRFKKELPAQIPPGDPRNAMGAAKFIIHYFTPGIHRLTRIHGTNDDSSIGKEVTRGCIRLHNVEILKFGKTVFGKKTKVDFFRTTS